MRSNVLISLEDLLYPNFTVQSNSVITIKVITNKICKIGYNESTNHKGSIEPSTELDSGKKMLEFFSVEEFIGNNKYVRTMLT
jgi:hypothetical protein